MQRWSGCLIVLLISCGGAPPAPSASAPRAAPSAVAMSAPGETGGATSCTRDDECFCRVFDGASFHPGRERSECCSLATGCVDALGANVPAGHCMTCVYD